jgi:GNAT superfamily N-acetyltransferase
MLPPASAGQADRVTEVSVRAATPGDAPAIAQLQLRAWRSAYAELLPAGALAALTEPVATAQWQSAIGAPPSPRHRVFVAIDGGRVVGVAAVGPDDDHSTDPVQPLEPGELVLLLVVPDARNRGHGSRLLAATMAALRGDGFARAGTWVLDGDTRLAGFLQAAGWAPAGSARVLDMGSPVREVRLHTDLRD